MTAPDSAGPRASSASVENDQRDAVAPQPEWPRLGLRNALACWVAAEGAWWATSFVFHVLLACVGMLVGSRLAGSEQFGAAPSFDEAILDAQATQDQNIQPFEVGEPTDEILRLDADSISLAHLPAGPTEPQTEKIFSDHPIFQDAGGGTAGAALSDQTLGGLTRYSISAPSGPGVICCFGNDHLGSAPGEGNSPGSGGPSLGFGRRGQGKRAALAGSSGVPAGERAVGAALNWLHRHQSPDGSWSIHQFQGRCKDGGCTGAGSHVSDSGGTALGLLPFLAAGLTHKSRSPYQQTVHRGLYYLLKSQKPDGDLSGGSSQAMYSHALATITLCEAYGLSKDSQILPRAEAAVRYIERAQHPRTGGWRYAPGEEGDTSVVGWQVMALKSAQMAGVYVDKRVLDGAGSFLKSCSSGAYGGQFAYQPGGAATPAMTAVGLLCLQYTGTKRDDPRMREGLSVLLTRLPDPNARNLYYWYYATQVVHNVAGTEWDTWNRQQRRVLITSQCKGGCNEGSWDPAGDTWGTQGGRLYATSLATLTLEVYYRYLPLYQIDAPPVPAPAPAQG